MRILVSGLIFLASVSSFASSECYKIGASFNLGYNIGGAAIGDLAFCTSEDDKYWVEMRLGGAVQNIYYNGVSEGYTDDRQKIIAVTFDFGKRTRKESSSVFVDISESRTQKVGAGTSWGVEGSPNAEFFENYGENYSLGFGIGAADLKIANIHLKLSPVDWYRYLKKIINPDNNEGSVVVNIENIAPNI